MDLTTNTRSEYTAGLRALADALDANPLLPLPYDGNSTDLMVFAQSKDEVVAYARLLHGKVDKAVSEDPNYGFRLSGSLHGLDVMVLAPREEVCERVVKGTREVTKEVPDPTALAAVPTTTVTETVEDVEWICRPLLADAQATA